MHGRLVCKDKPRGDKLTEETGLLPKIAMNAKAKHMECRKRRQGGRWAAHRSDLIASLRPGLRRSRWILAAQQTPLGLPATSNDANRIKCVASIDRELARSL
eukprot:scaffold2189_cov43-Prasinocladus_malaysianus.AAC.3